MQDVIEKAYAVNEDKRMLKEELQIIADWTDKYYKGGNTLEVGAYKGMTSYLLASVVKNKRLSEDKKHYIIDLFEIKGDIEWNYQEHPQQLLMDNLGELTNYCDVIQSPSLGYVALDKIFPQHFDYCFIDGDHTYPVVLVELLVCEILCDHILGHDYGHRGVSRSVDQFCELRGYTINNIRPYGLYELIKK